MTETKWCKGHNTEHPIQEFGKRAAEPDGRHFYCKKYVNEKETKRRQDPQVRDKRAASERERRKKPEVQESEKQRKSTAEYKTGRAKRGRERRAENPGSDNAAAQKWLAAHSEERASWLDAYNAKPETIAQKSEYQNSYYQLNKDRKKAARQTNEGRRQDAMRSAQRRALQQSATTVPFTEQQLLARLSYWGDKCWVCQFLPATGIDHVKPLKRGGSHMLCNFRPACGPCNSGKSAKWPWLDVLEYVRRRRIAVRRLHEVL